MPTTATKATPATLDWGLPFLAGAAVAGIAALAIEYRSRTILRPGHPNVESRSGTPSPQDNTVGLRLITEIQMPKDILGRLDHCSFDRKRKLLFQTCLGDNSVSVIDCFACKAICTIRSNSYDKEKLNCPQGVLFVEKACMLYVANAKGGIVLVFQGDPKDPARWDYLTEIDFEDEADNLRFDPVSNQVWFEPLPNIEHLVN
jgi:hypothetical protein